MHYFKYIDGELRAEDVPLAKIAEDVGTPTYVYSHATLTRHFKVFNEPFESLPHITCFSVKACSNVAILALFAGLGAGFDVVSGGELYRARLAGADPAKIVFSGVGKSEAEIKYALNEGILLFNVESTQEMREIDRVAGMAGKTAGISVRVNPDVDPKTHPYVSTGLKEHKFGIDINEALALYEETRGLKNVRAAGVDCHLGSQLTRTAPFVEALTKILALVEELKEAGFEIKYLDLGGGLGITYSDESPPLPKEYARDILTVVKDLDCTLIFEPGRVIAGNAGVMLTKVLYLKDTADKRFIIVDAGMNDLMRPSFYGAYHEILPLLERKGGQPQAADVVGPLCESGDFLAKGRLMPPVKPGEVLAVMSAGAYGFSMASRYNSRPLPAEVMVKGQDFFAIRERETYEDMTRLEKIPDYLRQA